MTVSTPSSTLGRHVFGLAELPPASSPWSGTIMTIGLYCVGRPPLFRPPCTICVPERTELAGCGLERMERDCAGNPVKSACLVAAGIGWDRCESFRIPLGLPNSPLFYKGFPRTRELFRSRCTIFVPQLADKTLEGASRGGIAILVRHRSRNGYVFASRLTSDQRSASTSHRRAPV